VRERAAANKGRGEAREIANDARESSASGSVCGQGPPDDAEARAGPRVRPRAKSHSQEHGWGFLIIALKQGKGEG
jgi:hypothetical protein